MQTTEKERPLEYFREFLKYKRADSTFIWKKTRGKALAGTVAGSPHCGGYVQIGLNGDVFLAHRLVWLFETGRWPTGVIDHINRDKQDNRFSNLRDCTQVENGHNSGLRPDNTSGVKGVSFNRLKGKYLAYITYRGKRYHCGWHDTVASAAAAREAFAEGLNISWSKDYNVLFKTPKDARAQAGSSASQAR